MRDRRHARRLARPLLLGCLAFIVTVGVGSAAAAETTASQPDYQGTYAGIATTNTGKQAPFTLFVKDRGDDMHVTVFCRGYTVRLDPAPEDWVGKESVQVDITVPGAYKLIATGSGTATFAKSGKLWEALGDGEGTVLVTKSGQATGEAEMVTRGFDQSKADAWIAAHPIKDQGSVAEAAEGAGVSKVLNTAKPPIEKVAAVVAPAASQPPVADLEKAEIIGLIGMFFAVYLVSAVIFGWNEPVTPELKDQMVQMTDIVVGYKPTRGEG